MISRLISLKETVGRTYQMQTFDEINLNKQINKALIELGFIKPTPIQARLFRY